MKIGNLEVYGIIYKITNKINNKVYIGQTVQEGGFKTRYRGDIERNTHNEHLKRSIHKYGINNFKINKIFDIAFSRDELNIKEICWINYYDATNKKYGYNIREGGNNGKYNREYIEFHLKGENNPNYGNSWSQEQRINLSKTLKNKFKNGYKHPLLGSIMKRDTKYKISNSLIGRYKGGDSPSSKVVICLNTKKTFHSLTEAGEYYNCSPSAISQCCNQKLYSCGKMEDGTKLVWMYYSDYLYCDEVSINYKINKANENHIKGTKVVCLNDHNIFDTISEASLYYKCDSGGIGQCCLGKSKSCGELNGEKLAWTYFENYLEMTKKEIDEIVIKANLDNKGENNPNSKKVICLTTLRLFNSATQGSEYYKCNNITICQCCKGVLKSSGKLDDGTKLAWMYYDDYLKSNKDDINRKIDDSKKDSKGANHHGARKVVCITTSLIFGCAKDGAKYYNCDNSSIGSCCKGKLKSAGKDKLGNPLKWMYYDEYIKQNQLLIHNENLRQAI